MSTLYGSISGVEQRKYKSGGRGVTKARGSCTARQEHVSYNGGHYGYGGSFVLLLTRKRHGRCISWQWTFEGFQVCCRFWGDRDAFRWSPTLFLGHYRPALHLSSLWFVILVILAPSPQPLHMWDAGQSSPLALICIVLDNTFCVDSSGLCGQWRQVWPFLVPVSPLTPPAPTSSTAGFMVSTRAADRMPYYGTCLLRFLLLKQITLAFYVRLQHDSVEACHVPTVSYMVSITALMILDIW